jgi:methylmalonyl-CoA mutase C-terminal domain/subunit
MEEKRCLKVLIAKPGLDGYDRGAKVVALGLRDEGMEVIYTDLRQTPERIAEAAMQEDVDMVGLSCLSGAHKHLLPETVRLLKERGADDKLVVAGGIIPPENVPFLKEKGISAVFGPRTSIKEIAEYMRKNVKKLKKH